MFEPQLVWSSGPGSILTNKIFHTPLFSHSFYTILDTPASFLTRKRLDIQSSRFWKNWKEFEERKRDRQEGLTWSCGDDRKTAVAGTERHRWALSWASSFSHCFRDYHGKTTHTHICVCIYMYIYPCLYIICVCVCMYWHILFREIEGLWKHLLRKRWQRRGRDTRGTKLYGWRWWSYKDSN